MEGVSRIRLLLALFFTGVNCYVFTQHNGWEMSAKGYRSVPNITEALCCYKCRASSDCEAIYYIKKQPTCIFHKGPGNGVKLTKNGVERNGTFTNIRGGKAGDWVYLVSGDHGVPNTSLSASEFVSGFGPEMARLNQTSSWMVPLIHSKSPWIQVRFENIVLALGITTQGCGLNVTKWVTKFAMFTSVNEDCTHMVQYPGRSGNIKHIAANSDLQTSKKRWLMIPVLARCVRLVPLKWFDAICLRFDLIGRYIIQ